VQVLPGEALLDVLSFPFRQHGSVQMSQNEEAFTAEERHRLAVKAVKRLIADAEAKRLLENQEVAETITACIREASERHLRVLKWLLEEEEQQELERPGLG
jgi:predicted transcriptional regulator